MQTINNFSIKKEGFIPLSLDRLSIVFNIALQEKQYSAVASNAKVLMKLIGLDTK